MLILILALFSTFLKLYAVIRSWAVITDMKEFYEAEILHGYV
jgi:hypothetical protein